MLASHAALRKQTELYNLGINIQFKHPRKIPLGKQVPLVTDKSNKKAKQRKKRHQREGKEHEQDEEKVRHQLQDERQALRQGNTSNPEGDIRQRIEETFLILQKQEAALRDMDVSTFSKSQTVLWHDALVNLNERTAEMVRETEVRCGINHKETPVEDSSCRDTQNKGPSQDEEGKEKGKKKEKTSKKKNRAQYDSRGWRVQPQPKTATLQKSQSLATLKLESPSAPQPPPPPPAPRPPGQRASPHAGAGTQSCPALPGRPPPAPLRPVPGEKAPEKFPVRLKPLNSGTTVSPMLSLLGDPSKKHAARERLDRATPETRTPASSNTPSTVHSSPSAEPRHLRLLTSENKAQRALGRLKTLQTLLSSKAHFEDGDHSAGTSGKSSARDGRPDQNGESSCPVSRGNSGTLGSARHRKVRISIVDESALPISSVSNVPGSGSTPRRQQKRASLQLVKDAVPRAAIVAKSHEEEQAAIDKHRRDVTDVFHKLKDETDHEIHRDSLPKALEIIGFTNPDDKWVAEVFDGLTCYNTLSEDEFLRFVEYYEDRQERAGAELFKQYDADGSGLVDHDELEELLRAFGITPMAKVIEETIKEVADEDVGELTLAQTKRLMDVLRQRQGFTLDKYQTFLEVFHRYNRHNTGEMQTQEVLGALGFLGYRCDPSYVESVCNEVDVDGTCTINEREFVVLMRKIHEHEIEQAQAHFQRIITNSPSYRVGIREVQELLKELGYLTEKTPMLEAAEDAGIYNLEDGHLSFEEFYRMLEVFRSREGFSRAEAKSIQEIFQANDTNKDGELTTLELGRTLRQLGCVANGNMQQKLIAEVDIDGSGSIDLSEMMKLIRKFNEWELQKSRKAFDAELAQSSGTGESPDSELEFGVVRSLDTRQTRRALFKLGIRESSCSSSSDSDFEGSSVAKDEWRRMTKIVRSAKPALRKDKRYDIWAFTAICSRLGCARRAFMTKCHGISPYEMNRLRKSFEQYDTDGSGEISDKELRLLLENLFPQLATSKESRPELVRLLDEADSDRSGTLDFDDFLRLVNQCKDLHEHERLQKEQKAIRDTGFQPEEVQGFRELFMGDVERLLLSFDDLKEMMSGVVPLGHKNTLELEAVFKPLASQTDAGQCADFSEFLHIMRRLLDTNFAGLEEHARRVATTARDEHS